MSAAEERASGESLRCVSGSSLYHYLVFHNYNGTVSHGTWQPMTDGTILNTTMHANQSSAGQRSPSWHLDSGT